MSDDELIGVFNSLCKVASDPKLSPLGWKTPYTPDEEITLDNWGDILQSISEKRKLYIGPKLWDSKIKG